MNRIKQFTKFTVIILCAFAYADDGCTDPVAENYDPSAILDDGSCFYDVNSWFVEPFQFQFDGSLTSAVWMDGERVSGVGDILAAFVDGECRGLVNGILIPNTNDLVFMVSLYSNEASGEMLGFRYYDSISDRVYITEEEVEFSANMILGSVFDPVVLNVFSLETDCDGEYGGSAFLDDCLVCSGGTTQHEANSDIDFCGVCFGENDCSGSGDLIPDSHLDILDVVRLVSIIMEETIPVPFEIWAGDLNEDDNIDVLDVITLLTIILEA